MLLKGVAKLARVSIKAINPTIDEKNKLIITHEVLNNKIQFD